MLEATQWVHLCNSNYLSLTPTGYLGHLRACRVLLLLPSIRRWSPDPIGASLTAAYLPLRRVPRVGTGRVTELQRVTYLDSLGGWVQWHE